MKLSGVLFLILWSNQTKQNWTWRRLHHHRLRFVTVSPEDTSLISVHVAFHYIGPDCRRCDRGCYAAFQMKGRKQKESRNKATEWLCFCCCCCFLCLILLYMSLAPRGFFNFQIPCHIYVVYYIYYYGFSVWSSLWVQNAMNNFWLNSNHGMQFHPEDANKIEFE